MTSDQTFRKIKKRAKKNGLSSPKTISTKGNRWFLIDKMDGTKPPSALLAALLAKNKRKQ